jgi:hypothetical protein
MGLSGLLTFPPVVDPSRKVSGFKELCDVAFSFPLDVGSCPVEGASEAVVLNTCLLQVLVEREDQVDIIEGGVLKIHRQDGTITYINPASWASIDDSPAPSVYGSPAHSSSGDVPPEEQPF